MSWPHPPQTRMSYTSRQRGSCPRWSRDRKESAEPRQNHAQPLTPTADPDPGPLLHEQGEAQARSHLEPPRRGLKMDTTCPPSHSSAPNAGTATRSHQVQVEADELQPGHQGQEESQVIVAADQGVPVRHGGDGGGAGPVASAALPCQQAAVLKCDM